MSVSNSEQYLFEPIPVLEQAVPFVEKLKENYDVATTAINLGQQTKASFEAIQNPETHSAIGAIGQYLNWKQLVESVKGLKEKIGNYYQIKIDGKRLRFTYDNTIKHLEYRLQRVKEGLIGLKMIYKEKLGQLSGSIAEYMALS
jgi:hypothetical protein